MNNEVFKNTTFNTLNPKVNNLRKKTLDLTTLFPINQDNADEQNLEKKNGDIVKKILDASG